MFLELLCKYLKETFDFSTEFYPSLVVTVETSKLFSTHRFRKNPFTIGYLHGT